MFLLSLTVSELFDSVAQDFFSKIQSSDHCLHYLRRKPRVSLYALVNISLFQLSTCVYKLFSRPY